MAEFREFAIEGFIEVESGQTSFESFMNRVWKESHTGISTLVVLDEVSSYGRIGCNDHPCLGHLYRLGRHKQIDAISISQRFYSLPPIVRSQTDIFHVFGITELRDRQYLKGLVSPAVLDTIIRLPQFSYININL